VEALGGALGVESAPGVGSRFFFGIPLEAAAAGPAPAPLPAAASPAPAAAERALRILLVDDAPDNRLLVRRYLKDSPHAVDEAADGRAAVAKFAAGTYDLVLMDVQMPELDGLSATREIRRLESERGSPPTPVIALTASVAKEDVRHCLEAGCDAFLAKPVRKADLLGAVRGARAPSEPPGEAIEVTADPEIADLIPGYLENRRKDLQGMSAALERGEFASIAAVGHTIRGSAASFGFAGLGEACREAEEAARGRDKDGVSRALGRMAEYLTRVRVSG
jgi:CheY-like chemotaxis protein